MIAFLASSLDLPNTKIVNPTNQFREQLKAALPERAKVVFIASAPDEASNNEAYARDVKEDLKNAGFIFASFVLLDRRNQSDAKMLLNEADFLIFAGGHVPTQNKFFKNIRLRTRIKHFDGVILGLSAGSMNCADVVYAQPELAGEAKSKRYKRFLSGLAITKSNVLPHYQYIKDETVDGFRCIEDLAFKDSYDRVIYAICDGSYILQKDGQEIIYGEAYKIHQATITKICENEERYVISSL